MLALFVAKMTLILE